MQSPIKIIKAKDRIKVSFSYNDDLVCIMREHEGWWWPKQKVWSFPLNQYSEIREALTGAKYIVTTLKEKPQFKRKPNEYKYLQQLFDEDKKLVSLWGTCKKCKTKNFIGRDFLCTKCILKIKH